MRLRHNKPSCEITFNNREYWLFANIAGTKMLGHHPINNFIVRKDIPHDKWSQGSLSLSICEDFIIGTNSFLHDKPSLIIETTSEINSWLENNMREQYEIVQGQYLKNRNNGLSDNQVYFVYAQPKDEVLIKLTWC